MSSVSSEELAVGGATGAIGAAWQQSSTGPMLWKRSLQQNMTTRLSVFSPANGQLRTSAYLNAREAPRPWLLEEAKIQPASS
jgi:hypothetical protein